MSPYYELTNQEAEAVYLALTGVVNLPLLQKTKKALQDQRLFHAVEEVNERLRLYEGQGVETLGLLRTFNPQHDMLAEGTARPGSKSDKAKDDTRDMFAEPPANEGNGSTRGEPLAQAWDDSIVPKPRPAKGDPVLVPTGQTVSVGDVLGWDVEREAFRIVTVDGWDGHVIGYGKRDAHAWRMLNQLLDYPDASDRAKEPLGSPAAIAVDLRQLANALLNGPEAALPGNPFPGIAEEIIPLLDAVAPDHIAPDYIRQYVLGDVAEQPDNVHALARLMLQYADIPAADHAEGLDAIVAAAHEDAPPEGYNWTAGDLDVDDDDVRDYGDGHETDGESGGVASFDDARSVGERQLADMAHDPGYEGSLAQAQDEFSDAREAEAFPEPAGTIGGAQIEGDDDGENGNGAAPEPSAQRKRNAARAGTKAASSKPASKRGKKGRTA